MPTWLQKSALQMRGAAPEDDYRLVDISKMFTQSMYNFRAERQFRSIPAINNISKTYEDFAK